MTKHRPERWGTYSKLDAVMGTEATAKFVEVFGGHRLWIPMPRATNHPRPQGRQMLTVVLGEERAQKLFDAFGGEYLMVPTGEKPYNKKVKRMAAEMHRRHVPITEIATVVGRSRRTVFRWLNEPITSLQ